MMQHVTQHSTRDIPQVYMLYAIFPIHLIAALIAGQGNCVMLFLWHKWMCKCVQ